MPLAKRKAKSPGPQRALYGQKSMPRPRATASMSRAKTPNVVVVRCTSATFAFSAGAFALVVETSASSEIDSSCLSIFFISLSQSVPAMVIL
jgi:hypothetical protein